jgi:glutamine synthetase
MSKGRLVQAEIPDYDLGLRGKLLTADKVGAANARFCTIIHGLSVVDEVTDTPVSNAGNGYPDAAVAFDESTRVELPWRSGLQAIIGDLVDDAGRPVPASARGQLVRLQSEYAGLGLVPVLGFEYEVWLFEGTDDAGRPRPLGGTENAYSLSRVAEVLPLATEFASRMEQIGSPIEAFHSELGPGFFEFALKPQPALKAADGAARSRQYLRDLAAETGLRASFMAKPYAGKSGAGGHVHSSLVGDGSNVFADSPGQVSALGASFVAGVVATLADLTVMYNPFVNSFKRIDKEMFVAEQATWSVDDRSAACRLLLDSVPGARVEHRRPGADANPYLVAAAVLGAGLAGITQSMPLPPRQDPDSEDLPGSLGSALERFESSARSKEIFGEDFVQVYAATRANEWNRYQDWLRHTITDWETDRCLESL